MKTELLELIKDNFLLQPEERTELKESIEWLNFDWYDYIDIDGGEYRVIPESIIERLFEESVIEMCDDCFIPDLPDVMKQYFDYDKFVQDCSYDWYGHHFSWYDGSEIEGNGLYLFRNN